jgi:hypothetical protein
MEKGGGVGMRKLAVFVAVFVAVLMTVTVFADEQAQLIADLGNWSIWAANTSNGRFVAAVQNTSTFYVNNAAYTVDYSVGITRVLLSHILGVHMVQLSNQINTRTQVQPLTDNGDVLCNITYIGWDNTPIRSSRTTGRYFKDTNILLINLDLLLYSMEAVLSKELRISFETNVGQVTVVVDISNIYRVLTELDIVSVGL